MLANLAPPGSRPWPGIHPPSRSPATRPSRHQVPAAPEAPGTVGAGRTPQDNHLYPVPGHPGLPRRPPDQPRRKISDPHLRAFRDAGEGILICTETAAQEPFHANRRCNTRSLVGKPLAGFRATPRQTYSSLIRHRRVCNTFHEPTITSIIDDKKTTAWGESGFPATFPARCGLCPRESLAWGRRTTSRWHTVEGLCRGNRSTADA